SVDLRDVDKRRRRKKLSKVRGRSRWPHCAMHNASRMKAPPPTLKSKTISSILWSVARAGWATVVSFLVFAFLARFLGPSDFGKFALASLAYEVARIIGNSGLPDAVVREAALDEVTADTVFWACIALNVVVAAVLFA